MKKLNKICFIFFLLISAIFINKKANAILPLSGKTIVVDPGHGGADPGTVNGNIYESNINLEISKELKLELSKVGAIVFLTRDGDYDLSTPKAKWRKKSDFDNRIKLINNSKANIYLSIHLNYLNNSAYSGAQVFYNNDKNKLIAEIIQNEFKEQLSNNRTIKKIPNRTYMYDKLEIPGVLIECGFISNSKEKELLTTKEYQKKISIIIKDALIKYFNK